MMNDDLLKFLGISDEKDVKAAADYYQKVIDEEFRRTCVVLWGTRLDGRPFHSPTSYPYPFVGGSGGAAPSTRIKTTTVFLDNYHLHPWDAPAGMEMQARLGYSKYILQLAWIWVKRLFIYKGR